MRRLRRRERDAGPVALERFDDLLGAAAAGELGVDGNVEAVAIVHALTGGRIDVFFHKREGRARQYGWGKFRPALSKTLRERGKLDTGPDLAGEEIILELRPLPLFERMADEVHRLYEEVGLNLCEIARRLGHNGVAFRCIIGRISADFTCFFEKSFVSAFTPIQTF